MQTTTLYVVPDCPICADVMNWLTQQSIPFSARDVTQDHSALRRMYRLTRQRLVPVIEAGDKVKVRPSHLDLEAIFNQ